MAWVYSSQAAVEALIGVDNLIAVSNDNPASIVLDAGSLASAGAWSDAYINGKFAPSRFKSPLAGMDAGSTKLIEDISSRLVVWWLYQKRGVRDVDNLEQAKGVAAIFNNHKKIADDMLAQILSGELGIVADLNPADVTGDEPGSFSFVPIERSTDVVADENSQP